MASTFNCECPLHKLEYPQLALYFDDGINREHLYSDLMNAFRRRKPILSSTPSSIDGGSWCYCRYKKPCLHYCTIEFEDHSRPFRIEMDGLAIYQFCQKYDLDVHPHFIKYESLK